MLLAACSDDAPAAPSGSGAGGGGGQGGQGGEASCTDPNSPPPDPPADPCERFLAGPAGVRAVAVDLSAAHRAARFFSSVSAYSVADQALVAALEPAGAVDAPDLDAYVAGLEGVACVADAASTTLPPATVEMRDKVALVRPGVGPVELPAGTAAVMIDLRGLPAVPELGAALAAAVGPALAVDVPGARRKVRIHDGMVDEIFSSSNVYTTKLTLTDGAPILHTGTVDLPIALLTDDRLAPDAAELAGTLRLAGRAWLVGEDVLAAVAESRWFGVGNRGVAVHIADLRFNNSPWPDVILADRRMADPACFAADLPTAGPPPAAVLGAATRPDIEEVDPFLDVQPTTVTLGSARAALVVAHAAARGFYPYFPIVGDSIDERLSETLGAFGETTPERRDIYQGLRRFGNALADGHNFVFDAEPPGIDCIPAYIEDINNEPVIRRSATAALAPGQTIISVDGTPFASWLAPELERSGGATPGYQFNIALRQLLFGRSTSVDLGLRDPDGTTSTVTVVPDAIDVCTPILVATSRPAGFLADLGAPSIYYINLDATVLPDISQFRSELTAAAGASGLVLDMRGYPGTDHYEIAARIIPETFSSPIFRVTQWMGLDASAVSESHLDLNPKTSPSYAGPVVLLVGHATVSAAENFSTMLVDAGRVTVVGRTSAATNGNITGVLVPAGFAFTFTGMDVRHADANASVFHGIGIVPDVDVPLDAASFAAGKDPELEAAIAVLGP